MFAVHALLASLALVQGWTSTPLSSRRLQPLRATDGKQDIPDEPLNVRRNFRYKQNSPRAKPQSSASEKPQLTSRLRVIAGEARGRRLESPSTMLRPMMGRVRESMFSTLISMGVFNAPRKVAVLDTFCGGGSVGIEAISRGAAFAGFVDLSREACDVALRNAKACGFETRAGAACVTAESAIEGKAFDGRKFDVVSITPPYDEVSYKALCDLLASSPIMNEDCVAVIEYPIELGSLPARLGSTGQLVGLRNRRYGRTVLAFYAYRPTGKLNLDPRPEEFEVSRWK